MDEPKRFVRYVLPGLAATLELCLLLFILEPCWMFNFVSSQFSKEKGLGVALAVLVASGGLGFMLANLYYAVLWCPLFNLRWFSSCAIDHRRAVCEADAEGIICLVQQTAEEKYRGVEIRVEPGRISRKEAWRIVTALWHARIGSSVMLKKANARTDTLTSAVHGLGTLLLGTAIAAGTVFVVSHYVPPSTSCLPGSTLGLFRTLAESPCARLVAFVVVALVLFLAQLYAFRIAVGHAQGVIEMIFLEDLRNEKVKKGQPVIWRVRPPQ